MGRELQPDSRSSVLRDIQRERSAVEVGRALRDWQAQTAAARFGREERFEHTIPNFVWDAGSRVPNLDDRHVVLPDHHVDSAAAGHGLDRIQQQIDDRRPEELGVRSDGGVTPGERDAD